MNPVRWMRRRQRRKRLVAARVERMWEDVAWLNRAREAEHARQLTARKAQEAAGLHPATTAP